MGTGSKPRSSSKKQKLGENSTYTRPRHAGCSEHSSMHCTSVSPIKSPGKTTWCVSSNMVEYSSVGPVFDGVAPVYCNTYLYEGGTTGNWRRKLLDAVPAGTGWPSASRRKQNPGEK